MGKIDTELNKYTSAKKLLKESIELSHKNGDGQTNAKAMRNLAQLYIKSGELHLFSEIEMKIKETAYYRQNRVFQGEFAGLIAEVKIEQEDFNEALSQVKVFEEFILELSEITRYAPVYDLIIRAYEGLEDFENAVKYYDKLLEVSEKVVNETNQKLLTEFEAKFQNEKKEKEIQRLQLESVSFQLQSLRAQLNPHFVFNTIGSISQDMNQENIESSKSLLRSFARMMKNNLEFAELENITLKQEVEFLEDYLSLEQNRLGERLSFRIEADENLWERKIPSMIVQPYVENSIKHGINPLPSNGNIEIVFTKERSEIVCIIKDNGVGRKQAAQNKLNSQEHLGRSTTINEKRLSLLNQNEDQKLEVEYIDLFDENNSPSGTQVRLAIKL